MNLKIAVPSLLATHALAGVVGFLVARSLLVKDPHWVESNRAVEAQLAALDAAGSPAAAPVEPPPGFHHGRRRFAVQDKGMSRVSFTSDAPLEQIVGTTTSVRGDLELDSAAPERSTVGVIRVAVGTLKTGIDKRDEHLQGEGWFDTSRYADAEFTVERLSAAGPLWPGKTAEVTVEGKLTIKGHVRPLSTVATVTWVAHSPALERFHVSGDLLRVKLRFEVRLADVGMSAEVIGQKVADVVAVDLNLSLVEVPEPAP